MKEIEGEVQVLFKNTYAYGIMLAGMLILHTTNIYAMEPGESNTLFGLFWHTLTHPGNMFKPTTSVLPLDKYSALELYAANVIASCSETLKLQLKEKGAGDESVNLAIEALARSLEEGFKKDGRIRNAFQKSVQMAKQELLENGEVKDAVDKLLAIVSKQIEEGEIKKSIEYLKAHIYSIFGKIRNNILEVSLGIAAITIVTFAAVYSLRVLASHMDRYLSTPKLILESSHKSLWQKVAGIFVTHENIPEMVFAPELKKRLDTLIAATKNIRQKIANGQKNVKYRNLMLWGPPGTGKTMFAKILAHSSGMEYVMMSGASFAQFKDGQGITEMNKLFEWAKRSKKGVLIFIDEAESFLGGRMGNDVTKESYHILNNFLNHTGTRSDTFMIVLATNHPELLDQAMHSRIDDAVQIKLPELAERIKILRLYRDTLLLDQKQNSKEFVESARIYFNDKVIDNIAPRMDDFSGRELAGVINTILTDAAVTEKGIASAELIGNVVRLAIEKNHMFADHLKAQNKFAPAAA